MNGLYNPNGIPKLALSLILNKRYNPHGWNGIIGPMDWAPFTAASSPLGLAQKL